MSNFTRFRKTAVAAINNITLTELFARMWSNGDDETLTKLAGNYEIISEKCDDENFNINIHDYVYDAGHSYLVIKVSGKDNYEIADDMLVYAYSIEVSENDSCPYTYETYVLKKENGEYYYALEFTTDPTINESTITLQDIIFSHGEIGADGHATSYGNVIDTAKYTLKFKVTSDSSYVSVDVDGIEYRITSLGIYTDLDAFDLIEQAAYDSKKHIWNKENACVVLKGDRRAYFYPAFENEKCSAYYLSSPIDTDDVVGIKIGEKIYYAK